jgi:hypothetical protein
MKKFVALGPGGWIVFTFLAKNSKEARAAIPSLRKRSDTIESVRLWREDDADMCNSRTRHHNFG